MVGAFQRDAFQDNAFQMAVVGGLIVIGGRGMVAPRPVRRIFSSVLPGELRIRFLFEGQAGFQLLPPVQVFESSPGRLIITSTIQPKVGILILLGRGGMLSTQSQFKGAGLLILLAMMGQLQISAKMDSPSGYDLPVFKDRVVELGLKAADGRVSRTRALRLARMMHTTQERLARGLAGALDRYFRAQARRGVSVFLDEEKASSLPAETKNLDPGDIIPVGDNLRLLAIARPYLLQMILAASDTASALIGAQRLQASDPQVIELLRLGGQRIVRINEITREAVQETIAQGLQRGLSDFEIARGVTELRDAEGNIVREPFRGLRDVIEETYLHRADTVARTEMAVASNEASVERYASAEITEVDIIDGPGCGWTAHDDPDVADGSRRTIGALRAQPISHPNCRRVPVPVIR
jgi:hypothetical protein